MPDLNLRTTPLTTFSGFMEHEADGQPVPWAERSKRTAFTCLLPCFAFQRGQCRNGAACRRAYPISATFMRSLPSTRSMTAAAMFLAWGAVRHESGEACCAGPPRSVLRHTSSIYDVDRAVVPCGHILDAWPKCKVKKGQGRGVEGRRRRGRRGLRVRRSLLRLSVGHGLASDADAALAPLHIL